MQNHNHHFQLNLQLEWIDCILFFLYDIIRFGPKKGFSYEAGPWGFEPQTAGYLSKIS